MTKSFEEFEVHKKGVLLTKKIYQLVKSQLLKKNLILKAK